MKLWKSWAVAMKDFSIFKRKRYIIYSLIASPLIFSTILPGTLIFSLNSVPIQEFALLISSFFTFFILLAGILPTVIASYSFIGEKVERSLEPLLATPTTDSELLFGKCLSAFLPSIAATYIGATIFIVFVDAATYGQLGYLLMPNLDTAVVLGVTSPLACLLSVEINVIISSRVNDIRSAQQLGSLVILPLVGIFILSINGSITPGAGILLIISAVLLIADLILFFISRATFRREEILTKWK
jgi:ABC-type Na+ efflux pump permease subunit